MGSTKLFKRLGLALTGMAMAIGVGVGLSQRGEYKEARALKDDVTVTINYNDHTDSHTATSGTITKTVETSNDLSTSYAGVKTKANSGDKAYNYGYAMYTSGAGYIYSTNCPTGYFPYRIVVNFSNNNPANAARIGANFSSSVLNTRNSSVNNTYTKGNAGYSVTNTTKANVYWNLSTTGGNVQIVSINITYKDVNATLKTLSSISLSPSTISGYVTGNNFNTDALLASNVVVTAHYDDASTETVTSSSTVTTVELDTGNNSVTVTYQGKTATLTVNANTQEAYDTEAAATVTGLINTVLNSSNSGATYVGEINAALDGYANLNTNAKSKVTNYTDLTTLKSNNANYIIFNNNLASDSSALSETPSGWWVPSSVSIGTYNYIYNGATDMARVGKSDAAGSFKISVVTANKKFGSIKIGVKQFGSDTGKVSVTGLDNITPTSGGNESTLVDVSSSNLTEVTIATTSKRAYITYVYFTLADATDVLDASLSKTGTPSKTVYVAGESFDPTGLTISATYNSGQNAKDVTNQVTWAPNPLTAGETSVTGTYIENAHSATITITGLTVNEYVSTNYGRIGQDAADLSGNYYLAYVDNGNAKVWNGDTTGAINSYVSTTVTNNVIASTAALDAGILSITKVAGGYTMVNSAGKYIYASGSLSNHAINVSGSDSQQIVNIEVNNDGIASVTFNLNETTIYLRYNATANQDKARFYDSESKVQGLTLFKAGATPTTTNIEDVNTFVSTYMHMNDQAYESEDYVGLCDLVDQETHQSPYSLAKAAFNALTAKQRAYFVDNGGEGQDYEDAYNRLMAWATANHESLNGSTKILGAVVNGGLITIVSEEKNNMIVIIAVVSVTSLLTVGGYFFIRRRKER